MKQVKVPRTTSRAVLYGRYSRLGTRDRASLITLDQQFDEATKIAKAKGSKVVAREQDENRSGGSMNREGLQRALAMIDSGEADTLIVSRLSRLARSVPDTFSILERVAEANGRVIAGDLDIDTSTPHGRLMLTLFAAFVEFERELKRSDFAEATSRSLDNGVKIGRAPVGYVKETRSRLVPVAEATDEQVKKAKTRREYGDAVVAVFEMRAARKPWREVRDRWHEITGEWKAIPTLVSIVSNRTYVGELVYGDRVEVDVHPALVDRETFDAAQTEPGDAKLRAPRGEGSLLAGVVYCGTCGRRMTSGRSGGGNGGQPVYVCQRRQGKGNGTCAAPVSIARERLDAYVVERLLDWAGDVADETTTSPDDEAIRDLDERERRLEDRRAAVSSKLADLDVEVETIADALAVIDAELVAVRDERAEYVAHRKVAGVRSTIREDWPTFDQQQRRLLISGGIDRIVVSSTRGPDGKVNRHAPVEDRVSIVWRRDD